MAPQNTTPDLPLVRFLSRPGTVHGWLDLGPGIVLGRLADGRVRQQGTIRAAMIVIDDPAYPTEENQGGKGNARPDGGPLRTARDHLEYFAADAAAFMHTSSYGLCSIEVTLIESGTATGVFRLSGKNNDTYPAIRGGNVNAYVLEALEVAKDALLKAGSNFDVLYVTAAENFEPISYGPTDVRGDKLWALGLDSYGALVRIGQDSYKKFKKKAFIHELGHDLGLPDLYVDGSGSQRDPFDGKVDAYPAVGHWGIMSQINSPSHDFLGWEKWQMGWIDDSQVNVIRENGTTTHALTASSVPGGNKLVVIPGPKTGVAYVVEYKRAAGVEIAPIKEETKPELVYEGIYICRVDGANRTMESPVTTPNFFPVSLPQDQTESAIATLARSALGPKSGVFSFCDKAAGLTFSIDPCDALPDDVSAPLTVTIRRETPSDEARVPVLSDACFLDLDTLELRTSHDLRGINNRSVKVERHGKSLGPMEIDHMGTGTLRLRLAPGTLLSAGDMAGVTVRTEAFAFFAPSAPTEAAPAAVSATPVIQAERARAAIVLTGDCDLSALEARHISLLRRDGTRLTPRGYAISHSDGAVTLTAHGAGDLADIASVQVAMASNYSPKTATATQMHFGQTANGIVLRAASAVVEV